MDCFFLFSFEQGAVMSVYERHPNSIQRTRVVVGEGTWHVRREDGEWYHDTISAAPLDAIATASTPSARDEGLLRHTHVVPADVVHFVENRSGTAGGIHVNLTWHSAKEVQDVIVGWEEQPAEAEVSDRYITHCTALPALFASFPSVFGASEYTGGLPADSVGRVRAGYRHVSYPARVSRPSRGGGGGGGDGSEALIGKEAKLRCCECTYYRPIRSHHTIWLRSALVCPVARHRSLCYYADYAEGGGGGKVSSQCSAICSRVQSQTFGSERT